MNEQHNDLPQPLKQFRPFMPSRILAGLVVLSSMAVLAAWAFGIPSLKSVLPWSVAMKANTAIGFIFAGISLALFTLKNRWPLARWLSLAAAMITLLLGLLTLSQYLFSWELGLDQLFFQEAPGALGTLAPGRMAPISAVNFILYGCALILAQIRRTRLAMQYLALLPGVAGLVGIISYLYNSTWSVGLGQYAQMAVHAAGLFILLSLGILWLYPADGLMKTTTKNTMGGWIFRRLVPQIVGICIPLGWLCLWGEKKHLFENSLGIALLLAGFIVILTALVYRLALGINQLERKQLQAEILASESNKKLKHYMSFAPDGVFIADQSGCFLEVNPPLCQMTGCSEKELKQLSLFQLLAKSSNKKEAKQFDAAMQTSSASAEFWCRHKDNSERCLSMSVVKLSEIQILGFCKNITERKQAERIFQLISDTQTQLLQLNNLEDAYILTGDKIHELIGDGYVVANILDEQIMATKVVKLFGFGSTLEKTIPMFGFDPTKTAYALKDMPPEYFKAYRSGKLEHLPGGIYEILMHRAPKVICESVETILNVKYVYMIGFTWNDLHFGGVAIFAKKDISELAESIEMLVNQAGNTIHRLWVEKELRVRNIILSTQQEASIDGILVVNDKNEIISINRRFLEMWGVPPETMAERQGERLLSLAVEKVVNPAEFLDKVKKLYAARTETSQDEIILKDGRIFERYSAPMHDAQGEYYGRVWYMHDITKRRALHEQLFQAQKMESIGRLASGIAHEINTPTQYVGDNVHFLQDSFQAIMNLLDEYARLFSVHRAGPLPPETAAGLEKKAQAADIGYLSTEVPKAFQQTLEGIERITAIVRAMKEFAHPGKAEKTMVDLNHAIQSTLIVARNEYKYVAELVTHLDPDLPLVPCLLNEFNQVILNMVVNSAHAIADIIGDGKNGQTTAKGTITVSTRHVAGQAEIRIADTGSGIPDSIRSKIFEPFFTTKPLGKGTGQGLAISRNVIVDKHHGSIEVESQTGQGTTFIIRLPLALKTEAGKNSGATKTS